MKKQFTKGYTKIDNQILFDCELGAFERGLLATLLSRPAGWTFSIAGLAKILPNGKEAIRSSVEKLETKGYLQRNVKRTNKGQFGGAEWKISIKHENSIDSIENNASESCKKGEEYPTSAKPLSAEDNKTTVCRETLCSNPFSEFPTMGVPAQSNKKNNQEETRKEGLIDYKGLVTNTTFQSINQINQINHTGENTGITVDTENAIELAKEQIDYILLKSQLKDKVPNKEVPELEVFVDALASLYTVTEPIVIRGQTFSLSEMRQQARKMDARRAGDIIMAFYRRTNSSPINSLMQYFRKAILNAK